MNKKNAHRESNRRYYHKKTYNTILDYIESRNPINYYNRLKSININNHASNLKTYKYVESDNKIPIHVETINYVETEYGLLNQQFRIIKK